MQREKYCIGGSGTIHWGSWTMSHKDKGGLLQMEYCSIYSFEPGFLDSTSCLWNKSIFLYIVIVQLLPFPCNHTLFASTTVYFFFLLFMGIWVVCSFFLFQHALNMSFDELMHPFLLGIFLEMEFLVCVYPMLVDAVNSSPKWLHQFTLILAVQKSSGLCHFTLSFCNPLS